MLGDAGGEEEVGAEGEGGEVVLMEPENGLDNVRREGSFIEEFADRFGREINFFNLAINDGGSGFFPERDDDDVARG